MLVNLTDLEAGQSFAIHADDYTTFRYLGREQMGGMHEETRVTVFVEPNWVEYGKGTLVMRENEKVNLVES